MSIVKSFSVGNGDMFYIYHNSENFTVIDCCYDSSDEEKKIHDFNEIKSRVLERKNQITRFISTHPDEDHIRGLQELDQGYMEIINFYCTANRAIKTDETENFKKYCELRDSSKAYSIEKGFSRKWINVGDEVRGSAGITCLWPNCKNAEFQKVLIDTANGVNFNNLSPILKYSVRNGASFMWMGDMENDFREKIKNEVEWPSINVLFAPHHGRESGVVSRDILKILNPDVIVIGEASSKHLDYYSGYNTITQNRAKDITFNCVDSRIDIYVSNSNYTTGKNFLIDYGLMNNALGHYIGSILL